MLADEKVPDFKALSQLSPEEKNSPRTIEALSKWISDGLRYTDVKFDPQVYLNIFKKFPEAFTPNHISTLLDSEGITKVDGEAKAKQKLVDTLLTHTELPNKCLMYGCSYGRAGMVKVALDHQANPHYNNNLPFRTAVRQTAESFEKIYDLLKQSTKKYLGEDEAVVVASRAMDKPAMRKWAALPTTIPAYKNYEAFDWQKINNPRTIAASPAAVKSKVASVNEAMKGIREAAVSGSWKDYQEFAKTPLFQVYLQESFWVQNDLLAAVTKASPQPGQERILNDLFDRTLASPAIAKEQGYLALLKTVTQYRQPTATREIDWNKVEKVAKIVKDENWAIPKFDDVLALAYLNANKPELVVPMLEANPRLLSDIPKSDEETKRLQAIFAKASPAKAYASNSNFVCAYWGISNAGVTVSHHHPDMELTSQLSGAIAGGHVQQAKAILPQALKAKLYGGSTIGSELASASPSMFKELITCLPKETELGYAEHVAFAAEKTALLPAGDSKAARFLATSQPKTMPQLVKQINDPAFSSFVLEKAVSQLQPELVAAIPKAHYGKLKGVSLDTNQAQHLLARIAETETRTNAAKVCQGLLDVGVNPTALQIASLLQTAPLMKQFMDPRIPFGVAYMHHGHTDTQAKPLVPTVKTVEEAQNVVNQVLKRGKAIEIA